MRDQRQRAHRTLLVLTTAAAATLGASVLALHQRDSRGSSAGALDASALGERGGEALSGAHDAHASERAAGHERVGAGSRIEHACSFESVAALASPSESLEVETEVAGALWLDLLAQREGRTIARIRFPRPEVRVERDGRPDEAAAEAVRRSLAAGVTVLLSDDHRTLGYRFPDEGGVEHRNLWRTLVDALRFVAPRDAGLAWRTVEQAVDGELRVAYERRAGAEVHRVRSRRPERAGESVRAQVDGVGFCLPAPELDGWFRELSSSELSTLAVPAATASHRLDLRCELRSLGRCEAEPDAWAGEWAPVGGDEDATRSADAREREQYRARLEGVRIDALFARCSELGDGLSKAERVELFHDLAWKLRLSPESAAHLEELLRAPGLPDDVAAFVLAATADAGTGPCQALLAALLEDGNLPPALRDGSVAAAFAVAIPTPALAEAVAATLKRPGTSQELASRCLLALGSMARKDGEDARAIERLLAQEQRAIEAGQTSAWLHALANSRHPRLDEVVARYAGDPDPSLRAAALRALRGGAGDTGLGVAWELSGDALALVRGQAARVLGAGAARADLPRLAAFLAAEADESVRRRALEGLRTRPRPSSEERELLAAVALGDRAPDLRELASALLIERHPR